MARGGKRAGAGRKPGTLTRLTREIAEKALTSTITPLEVLLGVMREAWEANNKTLAATYAKDAAPYCHPRLAAVAPSGKVVREVTKMTDDELTESIRRLQRLIDAGSCNGAAGADDGVAKPTSGTSVHLMN